MDFDELKEILCGLNEDGKPRCGIAFVYGFPAENEDGEFEILPTDVITMKKPDVELFFVADPLHSEEFIHADLHFPSILDPDMAEICELLGIYQQQVDENANDPLSCPTLSLFLVPSTLQDGDPFYLEMNFPLLVSMTSSSPKRVPDTVSMIFHIEDCQVLDDLGFSLEELAKEMKEEEMEEAREAYEQERINRISEEEERKKQERLERMKTPAENQPEQVVRIER